MNIKIEKSCIRLRNIKLIFMFSFFQLFSAQHTHAVTLQYGYSIFEKTEISDISIGLILMGPWEKNQLNYGFEISPLRTSFFHDKQLFDLYGLDWITPITSLGSLLFGISAFTIMFNDTGDKNLYNFVSIPTGIIGVATLLLHPKIKYQLLPFLDIASGYNIDFFSSKERGALFSSYLEATIHAIIPGGTKGFSRNDWKILPHISIRSTYARFFGSGPLNLSLTGNVGFNVSAGITF